MSIKTDGWAVEVDGELFSLWLTESAARKIVDGYKSRGYKGNWQAVPVTILREQANAGSVT
jgi:hypothetical protein